MNKRHKQSSGWLPGERFMIALLIVVVVLIMWVGRGG